jgi:hypothetical protein
MPAGSISSRLLTTTSLIGCYISSDRNLVLELSLSGPFFQVGEPLFRCRAHQGVSRAANQRDQESLIWFDTSKVTRNPWEEWRLLAEYHAPVRRARLGLTETVRCSRELYRFARLRRTRLKRELMNKWKTLAWRGGHA